MTPFVKRAPSKRKISSLGGEVLAARRAFFAGFAALPSIVAALVPFLAAFVGLARAFGVAESIVAASLAARALLFRLAVRRGLRFALVGHGSLHTLVVNEPRGMGRRC